jgi:hypothetical protein
MEVRMDRRIVIKILIGAISTAGAARFAMAQTWPPVTTYRNPGCPCCEKWRDLMADAGFSITMKEDPNLDGRATSLGIPGDLHGCHTGTVGDYVISGHIPPKDIIRLLAEKPEIRGLTVPGMPRGSPGMEIDGEKDPFQVLALKPDGTTFVFAKYE